MRKCQLQLAFNTSVDDFYSVVSFIPQSDKIIIEAGTPLIKRYGIDVVSDMRRYWGGALCADMKIIDGAREEVYMAKEAGATSVTAMGTTSNETLRLFVQTCREAKIQSVIDMMNVQNPMRTLWKSGIVPDAVFIHRGRDEENAYGKIIQYKELSKIKGKWDITLGAAGGIDTREFQSAVFNNADIVVVNMVAADSIWKGIKFDQNFKDSLSEFLQFVN